MTASIFTFLEQIGFTHPLHPGLTHLPMGMVMGCFFFSLVAWLGKKPEFNRTALHCAALGLVLVVPTVIAGLLDWLHRYGGQMQPLIITKMVLAALLPLLLSWAIRLHHTAAKENMLVLAYSLCLACAIGLGFAGGELVYGG